MHTSITWIQYPIFLPLHRACHKLSHSATELSPYTAAHIMDKITKLPQLFLLPKASETDDVIHHD